MAKRQKKKRKNRKSLSYTISLFILSVFLLGLYGLFHLGKWQLIKNAPNNSLNKEVQTLGIDVSEWQNEIDFKKVKRQGYSFVIVRSSYGMYKHEDVMFHQHVQGALDANLAIGAYHYSHATTIEEARQEAEFMLSIIDDYTWDLPIFYDIETDRQHHLSRDELTQIALTFLTTIEEAGYQPGIYAASSWLIDRLDMEVLDGYPVWVASYSNHLTYEGEYDYWQYTDKGEVDGVEGHCDINIMYK